MKRIIVPLFIGLALLTGVGIGYCMRETPAAPDEPVKTRASAEPRAITDQGEQATLAALRARVTELERLLAAQAAVSQNWAMAATNRPPRGPEGFRNMLARMQKENPARYAQMTNRMAKFRERRRNRAATRLEYLRSIDVSHMSSGAKATHAKLQQAIADRETLAERLHDDNLTEEDRRTLFDEMRSSDRDFRRLNAEERQNLFEETARTLGFEGDDVSEISATLADIVSATESSRGDMPPPGPPPDGGAQPPPRE